MLTKTKTALVAALMLGSVSGAALADGQFDVNIYRPAPQDNALGAYAQEPVQSEERTDPRAAKPFTIEEKLWMDRASQPS
jgi:hypothetical protein